MAAFTHISWDNFCTTILVRGQQRVHRISGAPLIELFSDGTANRIGLSLYVAPGTEIPNELSVLSFISCRLTERSGRDILEVSTSTTALYRQFFHFAEAVAERIAVERLPAVSAVQLELDCFSDLLATRSILGIERQIGLLGELLFLERLVGERGPSALEAWLGPLGEPHDFRLQSREFEVKATSGVRRIHIINGPEQLVPSAGCTLHLVSVLLGPPGNGRGYSLADKVVQLAMQLEPLLRSRFEASLERAGYRGSDASQYSRRFTLRRPLAAAPVLPNFPAITRPIIQEALGPLAPRIESLNYEVNIEGLEYEDGSAPFNSLVVN